MKNYLKVLGAAACTLMLLVSAGCATIEGAGKDIESAGEVIQDSANNE